MTARLRPHALLVATLMPALVAAQQGPRRPAVGPDSAWSPRGWFDGASVALHAGPTLPSARGQAYALFSRVLTPGGDALAPAGVAAQLRLRATRAVNVDLQLETGRATVASTSRVAPIDRTGAVAQTTRLDVTALATVGLSWRAWAWRARDAAPGDDRLRITLGAGFGQATWRLRQWGDFVDTDRRLTFADDFRSCGAAVVGYAALGAEVPVTRRLSLDASLARHAGRAAMGGDFGRFDAFDLGGTRLRLGVRVGGAQR